MDEWFAGDLVSQVDLERAPVTTSRLRTPKLRQRVGESASRLAASVGNDEGQQPRHNRKSSSADRSGRVRHRGQAMPFPKPTGDRDVPRTLLS